MRVTEALRLESESTSENTAQRMLDIKMGVKLHRRLAEMCARDFGNLSEAISYAVSAPLDY